MKLFKICSKTLVLLAGLGLLGSGTALAAETGSQQPGPQQSQTAQDLRAYEIEHKFEKAQKYFLEYNPGATAADFEKLRPWLKPFTDAEVMADMFTDPRKMVEWMNRISEPDAVYLMMKCSTEPVMWDTWLRGLTDYNKLTRAMFRFMEPQTYMNWMIGWFDPNIYVNMIGMMDPNKYMRWMAASGNPKFYEPMFAFLDPNWYTPRMQWMFDPQTFQPVLNMFAVPVPNS